MKYWSEEDEQWVSEDLSNLLASEPPVRVQRSVRTRTMNQEEIRSKRQYACDVGHNAGQCVGNMCNYALNETLTKEEKLQRMQQSLSVAKREMAELEGIARDLMAGVS